jgi:hypothetical protein
VIRSSDGGITWHSHAVPPGSERSPSTHSGSGTLYGNFNGALLRSTDGALPGNGSSLTSVQSWEYSQSSRPTRRRSTPRSATPQAGFTHRIWQRASTAASTGNSSSRARTPSTPPQSPSTPRPEHDVRSDTVPGRPADNRRRSHLATLQHRSRRAHRSPRSLSTAPAPHSAGTNGAGVVQVRLH